MRAGWLTKGGTHQRLPSRLREVQARCAHERAMQPSLADVFSHLQTRSMIDCAKTMVMRARALAVACDEPLGMLAQLWQPVESAYRC